MNVNMIMKGLAKMQDDIWAMWNDPAYSQEQKDNMIKDFGKFLDKINDITSPLTIEHEVALQIRKRKELKERLQ